MSLKFKYESPQVVILKYLQVNLAQMDCWKKHTSFILAQIGNAQPHMWCANFQTRHLWQKLRFLYAYYSIWTILFNFFSLRAIPTLRFSFNVCRMKTRSKWKRYWKWNASTIAMSKECVPETWAANYRLRAEKMQTMGQLI